MITIGNQVFAAETIEAIDIWQWLDALLLLRTNFESHPMA